MEEVMEDKNSEGVKLCAPISLMEGEVMET
jgi:hypothetical protein